MSPELSKRSVDPDRIHFPEDLPVSRVRDELADAIARHQVVVVCGDTGSGKTTQLPKICLALGRGVAGRIAHTQPRRIAARSVARRIGEELGLADTDRVAYKVRFDDRSGPGTAVKLMTDGMLLSELQDDPDLREYDTVILDEAHERSLNIDFILGVLRRLVSRRPDLKLIITSATIDPEAFARFFDDAPVIRVEGRSYPVEVRYRPPAGRIEDRLEESVTEALAELHREGPGDTLIFLPGERQIHELWRALRRRLPEEVEVLPLYGRLPPAQQNRIFRTGGRPRVILATNVAETSLTVPGIRYVIDTGLVRLSRYSTRHKVQRLPVEPISRASAAQRAGRCGRVADGICIRLYDEASYDARPAFTDPEILRTNLASVILQMQHLGLGEVADFPFLDPPAPRQVRDGYRLLEQLAAVDADGRITGLGRRMARLPLDPRMARMLLEAEATGESAAMLTLTAGLSVQEPRLRPPEQAEAADQAHAPYRDRRSDFLGMLRLYDEWRSVVSERSRNQQRRWCEARFLSYQRMREWQDVRRQLRLRMEAMSERPSRAHGARGHRPDVEGIHRALLTGLLDHIGRYQEEDRDYLGPRGIRFLIFPGSGLAKRHPRWLVAAEIVETTRVFARTVAEVRPAWIERAAAHLVKRDYEQPGWDAKRDQVTARETVSLYGLVLSTGRRVAYTRVDPAEARRIFIRDGLVADAYESRGRFQAHNRAVLAELEALAARQRRPEGVPDSAELVAHYEAAIPEEIVEPRAFERWCRRREKAGDRSLYLDRAALIARLRSGDVDERFPLEVEVAGTRLPVEYAFAPGDPRDGVTLEIPAPLMAQLRRSQLALLIPGMVEESIIAMLRALPKSLRRHFVPVPDFARACREAMSGEETSLTGFLSEHLERMTGRRVPLDAWDLGALPEHLQLKLRVLGPDGEVRAEGRDLEALAQVMAKAQGGDASAGFASGSRKRWERTGLRSWPDDLDIPEAVDEVEGDQRLRLYPSLVDEGDQVSRRLLADAQEAAWRLERGAARLAALKLRQQMEPVARTLAADDPAVLGFCTATGIRREVLIQALTRLSCQAGSPAAGPPRDARAFAEWLAALRPDAADRAERMATRVREALEAHGRLRRSLDQGGGPAVLAAHEEVAEQAARLLSPGLWERIPPERVERLPTYLEAMRLRLERLQGSTARDRARAGELAPLAARLADLETRVAEPWRRPEALDEACWALEELRVSCFAQDLGVRGRVSVKRLRRAVDAAEDAVAHGL